MNDSYIILAAPLLMVLVLPAIVVAVTRAAAEGRIARNGAIGVRTRGTQASNQAWVAGHTAALPATRRTWWVALPAVPAAVAGQAILGGDIGVGVAKAALLLETAVLLCAAKAANAAARTAHALPETS